MPYLTKILLGFMPVTHLHSKICILYVNAHFKLCLVKNAFEISKPN